MLATFDFSSESSCTRLEFNPDRFVIPCMTMNNYPHVPSMSRCVSYCKWTSCLDMATTSKCNQHVSMFYSWTCFWRIPRISLFHVAAKGTKGTMAISPPCVHLWNHEVEAKQNVFPMVSPCGELTSMWKSHEKPRFHFGNIQWSIMVGTSNC